MRTKPRNRLCVAATLLLLGLTFAVLTAAPTYARYLTRNDHALSIQTSPKKTLSAEVKQPWTQSDDGRYTATYTVTGDATGYVRLFWPKTAEGDTPPSLTVTVAGEAYTAEASPVEQGTPLYEQKGEGWLYTLTLSSGEEWLYTPTTEDITITFSTATTQIPAGTSAIALCLDEVCE